MSRNTITINILKERLSNISILDGQVGHITESLIPIIESVENNKRIEYSDIKRFRKECERYNSLNKLEK